MVGDEGTENVSVFMRRMAPGLHSSRPIMNRPGGMFYITCRTASPLNRLAFKS